MQQEVNIFESSMDETAKAHLLETTRWTKFLAIMGFIATAFIILMALFMLMFGAVLPSYSGVGAVGSALYFLVMAALYFYPAWALIRFSSLMKRGINTNNQEMINDGLRHQKNMYRYLGILTIILLVFVLLMFVIAGVGIMMNV